MKKILFVFGTRPEAVKCAPLVIELRKHAHDFDVKVCVTAQHREMLDQVLGFFGIVPDMDLNLMKPAQTLFDITANALTGLGAAFDALAPDLVFVQGDTSTVLAGALAAYYKKVRVAHLEAGLRSGDKYSPFPEEMNRKLAGHIADLHFAPTQAARDNLAAEGITRNVWVTGNTGIDALFLGLALIRQRGEEPYRKHFSFLDPSKRLAVITGHRRESFGKPFEEMCLAFREIADAVPDAELCYPVHLNPNVREPVYRLLQDHPRIHLIDPLPYPDYIWLMEKSHIILTDSGGVQEEAPSLGKPVLVMRDVTERQEGIAAGTARLVGTDRSEIVRQAVRLFTDADEYGRMARAVNPYGDGHASEKIAGILSSL